MWISREYDKREAGNKTKSFSDFTPTRTLQRAKPTCQMLYSALVLLSFDYLCKADTWFCPFGVRIKEVWL